MNHGNRRERIAVMDYWSGVLGVLIADKTNGRLRKHGTISLGGIIALHMDYGSSLSRR